MLKNLEQHHDWAWLNRRYGPYAEFGLPLGFHAKYYATGKIEGIMAYRGDDGLWYVWMLEQHMERLVTLGNYPGYPVPFTVEELVDVPRTLVGLNADNSSDRIYIRPDIFLGVDPATNKAVGVDPDRAEVWASCLTLPAKPYLSENLHQGGVKLFISDIVRPDASSYDGTAKINGPYGTISVMLRLLAKKYGCTEGAARNRFGDIVDCSGQNIFAVVEEDGQEVFYSPNSRRNNVLHGYTETFLFYGDELKSAGGGLQIEQMVARTRYVDAIPFELLRTAKGLGLAGTYTGVMPVTAYKWIDPATGKLELAEVGNGRPHPKVLELARHHDNIVRHRYPGYDHLCVPAFSRDEALERAAETVKLS